MRIHVLNDLHINFGAFTPPPTNADVVVVAGDVHCGSDGVEWAGRTWPDTPVVFVCGNHDYYGGRLPDRVDALRRLGARWGVHVLQRDAVEIDGVVFLGCTLWTDLKLVGRPRQVARLLQRAMADYRTIEVGPDADLPGTPADAQPRLLRPFDTARYHHQSRRWLTEALAAHAGAQRVVVTHHAPSPRSLPDDDRGPITAAYASRMDDFVAASGAALWIHGHTHARRDYRLGATRVVCNARGYAGEPVPGFDPGWVVEVAT